MPSARRSPNDDTRSREALLDAAEALMISEGYASVTTRRVAAEAGVNNGLVSYYFGTMDELFRAVFRRAAARGLGSIADVRSDEQPLWRMWDSMREFSGNALMTEFIALSNHRGAIRDEIAQHSEKLRHAHIAEITRILDAHGGGPADIAPGAMVVLMVGVSRFLQMESSFGVVAGHDEAVDVIERWIRSVEGERSRP